jgi:hypothetical protein
MTKQYRTADGKIVPAGHPEAAFIHNPQRHAGKRVRIGDDTQKTATAQSHPLLAGKVKDVVGRLADASEEQLAEALELEQAADKPRKGVLEAIFAEQEMREHEGNQEGDHKPGDGNEAGAAGDQ